MTAKEPKPNSLIFTFQSADRCATRSCTCKSAEQAREMVRDAKALVEAGLSAIVPESVVREAARLVTDSVDVPTIGIGCGDGNYNGEVAVITPLIGSFPWFVPGFGRPEMNTAVAIREAAGRHVARVTGALSPIRASSVAT